MQAMGNVNAVSVLVEKAFVKINHKIESFFT